MRKLSAGMFASALRERDWSSLRKTGQVLLWVMLLCTAPLTGTALATVLGNPAPLFFDGDFELGARASDYRETLFLDYEQRSDCMWCKCAGSTLGIFLIFTLLTPSFLSPRSGAFRDASSVEVLTDEEMTAIESGQMPPPKWAENNTLVSDTQDMPKPPASRKVPYTRKELEVEAWNAARTWNVHPLIYLRLVNRESRWRVRARSPLKYDPARGLSQLRCKTTARSLGYDDKCYYLERYPLSSLFYGAKYLRKLVDRYGNYKNAIAAYYAGPTRWNQLKRGLIPRVEALVLENNIKQYLAEVLPETDRIPAQFAVLDRDALPGRCVMNEFQMQPVFGVLERITATQSNACTLFIIDVSDISWMCQGAKIYKDLKTSTDISSGHIYGR